jgi:asparagine synthase (glutamine-hydrolysing)
MCGIFAAIALDGIFENTDFEKFVSLTDMIHYRGPDGRGYKTLNAREPANLDGKTFNIFIGHRRLSIIDLSEAGQQPLTDGKGLWIVYNGEIFNYLELRENLKGKGHFFRTETDTEVILEIYKEYGEVGFNHLNGMWAFIIVDMNLKKIIVSRDRFSIKPLYFLKDSKAIYFASEIKQLIPLLRTKEINESIMFRFLKQGLLDHTEETFFRSIYRLKPKSNMIIHMEDGDIEEKEYWKYEMTEVDNEDAAIERLRELLYDSIKLRLRSDVKTGTLLSGGLDSSTITFVANDLTRGDIDSFSVIAPESNEYSEEQFIKILVDEVGIRNKRLSFHHESALEALQKVIVTQDEPFGSFSVIAQNLIFKEIKENSDVTVVLSGQGGDEVMMGYLKYFFFYVRELIKEREIVRALKQMICSTIYRTAIWQFQLGTAKRYIPHLAKKRSDYLGNDEGTEEIWKFRDLRERQIMDIDRYSIPALTHYEDRNSMAYSLEVRHPFLDHRMVNFFLSLPVSLKVKNGWTKYILRRAVNRLPRRIAWRRDKKGFITPEEDWLEKDLKGFIQETFKRSVLGDMGIIRNENFLSFYDDFLKGKKSADHSDISRVLIAEFWARHFFA